MLVQIQSELFDQVLDAGDDSPTEEICGALLGKKTDDVFYIDQFIQTTNISENKPVHYIPNPDEWLRALNKTTFLNKKASKDFIGVFHTHPHHVPRASSTDINEAGYAGIYWIYSLKYKTSKWYFYDGNEKDKKFTTVTMKLRKEP